MTLPRVVHPGELFGRIVVLVERQADRAPVVPSTFVGCSRCGAACWLDERITRQVAEPVPVCLPCMVADIGGSR